MSHRTHWSRLHCYNFITLGTYNTQCKATGEFHLQGRPGYRHHTVTVVTPDINQNLQILHKIIRCCSQWTSTGFLGKTWRSLRIRTSSSTFCRTSVLGNIHPSDGKIIKFALGSNKLPRKTESFECLESMTITQRDTTYVLQCHPRTLTYSHSQSPNVQDALVYWHEGEKWGFQFPWDTLQNSALMSLEPLVCVSFQSRVRCFVLLTWSWGTWTIRPSAALGSSPRTLRLSFFL